MASTDTASLRFAGIIQLRSNGNGAKTAPVRVIANSGGVIDYPNIGPICFDFASMTHKPRIPLDWSHDAMDSIGYLNKFELTAEGLVCSGAITPVEGDYSAVILSKLEAGTPYEASVEAWGGELEFIDAGDTAVVNGKGVVGPVFVVHNWELKAVAVCKFGRDSDTSVDLLLSTNSATNAAGRKVFKVEMSKKDKGEEMSNQNDEGKPVQASAEAVAEVVAVAEAVAAVEAAKADDQKVAEAVAAEAVIDQPTVTDPKAVEAEAAQAVEAVETVEAVEEPKVEETATKVGEVAVTLSAKFEAAADPREEFRQFVAAFGGKAATYFADGLSFADATTAHMKFQQQTITDLKQRLQAADRGAATPVQFSDNATRNEARPTFTDLFKVRK